MDHLALPRDLLNTPHRAAYVCEPYDEEDFLTFPDRLGGQWTRFSTNQSLWHIWRAEKHTPTDDGELARFLQRWLFFGLLHELFAGRSAAIDETHPGMYSHAEYIHLDNGIATIQTSSLPERLQQWTNRVELLGLDAKAAIKIRLTECVGVACRTYHALWSNLQEYQGLHQGFDRAIQDSLLCLVETITNSADKALDVLPDLMWAGIKQLDVTNHYRDNEQVMMKPGWCPNLVAVEEAQGGAFASRWYMQHLRQPLLGLSHGDCNKRTCERLNVDKSYQPRHVTAGCDCRFIGPSMEDVARALREGTYPLLRLYGATKDDMTLVVEPYTAGKDYLALSHVWSDGLGNKHDNLLPACQLSRLKTQISIVQQGSWKDSDEQVIETSQNLAFWIDTLLCPVAPSIPLGPISTNSFDWRHPKSPSKTLVDSSQQLHALALAKMRDVYLNAKFVLVLDRGLETFRVRDLGDEADIIEAAARIVTSRWMQRLWTYQEASLATKLLIRFANMTVDSRQLIIALRGYYHVFPSYTPLLQGLDWRLCHLRLYVGMKHLNGVPAGNYGMAVRHRSVTYIKDEPLVAAAILDLDLTQIARHSDHAGRLQALWKSFAIDSKEGIMDRVIFNSLRRCEAQGIRWAPRSLVRGDQNIDDVLWHPDDVRRARLSPEGLHVNFVGWKLALRGGPWLLQWRRRNPRVPSLFLRSGSKWYTVLAMRDSDAQDPLLRALQDRPHLDWHIILDRVPLAIGDDAYKGVLGYLTPTDPRVLRSEHLVVVRPAIEVVGRVVEILVSEDVQTMELYYMMQRFLAPRWSPTFLRNIISSICSWLWSWRTEPAQRRLSHILPVIARGLRGSGELHLADAVDSLEFEGASERSVIGDVVVVSEVYGPDHPWIVD